MLILFQAQAVKEKSTVKFDDNEKAQIKSFLDNINTLPNATKDGLDLKQIKKDIDDILKNNKHPNMKIEGLILVLTQSDIDRLKIIFNKLGYDFQATLLDEEDPAVRAWNDKYAQKQDIEGFYKYLYKTKPAKIIVQGTKAVQENTAATSPKSAVGQKPQVYEINVGALAKSVKEIEKKVKELKEEYDVGSSSTTTTGVQPSTGTITGAQPTEKKEIPQQPPQTEQQQPPATEQQQPKTDNQTQQEPTFTEPIKIDNIDFNNPKYGYKVDKLIKGEIVEYNADLETKDKTGKTLEKKLIEEINKLTGKRYRYVEGYPQKIGDKRYKVKIEEIKGKEQGTTKEGKTSNNQNLQTNTQVQNNDMMEEIKKNEDYKWLVKNIFTKGKEVSPKITNLAQKIANGEEKITMESFKSGQKVDDVEDYFKKLAAAFEYELNEFKYEPAEKKGSHLFNITLTKAKSQANEIKPQLSNTDSTNKVVENKEKTTLESIKKGYEEKLKTGEANKTQTINSIVNGMKAYLQAGILTQEEYGELKKFLEQQISEKYTEYQSAYNAYINSKKKAQDTNKKK